MSDAMWRRLGLVEGGGTGCGAIIGATCSARPRIMMLPGSPGIGLLEGAAAVITSPVDEPRAELFGAKGAEAGMPVDMPHAGNPRAGVPPVVVPPAGVAAVVVLVTCPCPAVPPVPPPSTGSCSLAAAKAAISAGTAVPSGVKPPTTPFVTPILAPVGSDWTLLNGTAVLLDVLTGVPTAVAAPRGVTTTAATEPLLALAAAAVFVPVDVMAAESPDASDANFPSPPLRPGPARARGPVSSRMRCARGRS